MFRFLLGAAIISSCLPLVSLEAQPSSGTSSEKWTIETVAGGGPLGDALLPGVAIGDISGLVWDLDGNLIYTDSATNVIRRIDLDTGMEETIAGTGIAGFSGDGGPATAARLNSPALARFDGDGNLYFVDARNYRVRKVIADGTISTVLGSGLIPRDGMDLEGDARELAVPIAPVNAFDVDAAGNIYFGDFLKGIVRKALMGTGGDGQVRIIAGIPDNCQNCSDGNGGPATAAHFTSIAQLAVGPDGSVYVVEFGSVQSRIRRISPDGIVSAFAGDGDLLPCFSNGGVRP